MMKLRAFFVSILLALLMACGAVPGEAGLPAEPIAPSELGPEVIAQNFFEDLRTALKDPNIVRDEARGVWVEKLAGYFAPAERDDQRAALRAALSSFANDISELDPNQALTLELRFDGVEKLSDDGTRAMVRPINASIHLLIVRTTETGKVITEYEQQIGLNQIIGRADGAVPMVRVGGRWFLTEG